MCALNKVKGMNVYMEVLEALNELIMNLLNLLGSWGALLGCVFILFESIESCNNK